jgi:hypothetical protein
VLQTLSDGRHEWLDQLGLLQLAQKAQSGAADKLIGMLQVLEVELMRTYVQIMHTKQLCLYPKIVFETLRPVCKKLV